MKLIATVRAAMPRGDLADQFRIAQDIALSIDLICLRSGGRVAGDRRPGLFKIQDGLKIPGWAFALTRETRPEELVSDTARNLIEDWEDRVQLMMLAVKEHANSLPGARLDFELTMRVEAASAEEAAIMARDGVLAEEIPA